MNTVRGNSVDPDRGKPIVRWLLALVSFHGASAFEIEYRDDSPVKQGPGERFSTRTPYPSEAILKKVMGDDFENSLDRVILVSTQDGLDQLLGNKLDFKDRIHNWTVKSSNPSNSVISLPVEFANFDVMKLWNQFDEATREFNPPDEIIADLSGLGVHHSVALSRVLKTYSMIRSLSAEQNSLKVKVYSTTLDKTPDVKDKGWVIDQGVLDLIDEFSRGVYEFTKHADPEPLIDLIRNLREGGVDVGHFIKLIRDFSARLREGLPFNAKYCQDAQALKLFEEIENSVAETKPQLKKIIHKAVQQIRKLLQAERDEKLLLDNKELKRQVLFAEQLVIQGSLGHALRIYREVIFCRILLEQNNHEICQNGNWLEREHRGEAEAIFKFIHRNDIVPSLLREKKYQEKFDVLTDLMDDRNHVAHSGFNKKKQRIGKLAEKYDCKKRATLRGFQPG